jgi:hypothetical protein
MHIHGKFHVMRINDWRNSGILQMLDSKQFRLVVLLSIREFPAEPRESNEEKKYSYPNCISVGHIASLQDIHRFDAMMMEAVQSSSGSKLLFTIDGDLRSHIRNLFLLGCHLNYVQRDGQ